MKFVTSLTMLSMTCASEAFVVNPSTSAASRYGNVDSRLYISSWGTRGPPSRWKEEDVDPSKKISAYLKTPEPVAARSNLDGTVLVSGWVNSKDRTDQTVFDFLNSEDSAFKFEKIVAFVDDAKFAKKRLISRSARYTGLLDKLDFIQAESEGSLPTHDQLESVKSWVVNTNGDLAQVSSIGVLAKSAPSVENVSILLSDAQDLTASSLQQAKDAVAALNMESDSKAFTLIVVGKITETPEGSMPYEISEFGTEDGVLPTNATYSRDESLRLVTECLGLASGVNKALVFQEVNNVNQTEAKLVRGLREGGYTRSQEIDHMITQGPKAYEKACEDYKTRVPESTPHDEWLLQKQKELDETAADRKERTRAEYEEKKKNEIEDIAREWAKREYFRKSMSGDMPYSEEEYVKSVWERALFEGDLKYRMLHGQATDERKELAEFKKNQEKKKATMLERAKASLQELLDEDDLVKTGDDSDDSDDE